MSKSVFDRSFQNEDLASKITTGLERISESFKVLLWNYAKKINLSPIQIQILIFLQYHEEQLCNVSALAKEFNVSKPTISDAVKVLAKKELIEKITSAVDKRAYSIRLSEQGEAIVRETEHFANPIHKVIADFSEEQQLELFNSIASLIRSLNKADILTVQRTCYNCRYYSKKENQHFCKLLDMKLFSRDIRLDCPEFESSS